MTEDAKRGIVDELYRPARKNFPRRKVELKGIDDLWQIDLVDMQKHARVNGGHKYILTVIDGLSKFAWAVGIRDKRGESVTSAMKKVFLQSKPRVPINIQCDAGLEFYNTHFKALMKRYDINMYSTSSVLKASIVERFNRTIKGWMYKEFAAQGNYKWLKLLPELIKKYNTSVHRTIAMRPVDVNKLHDEKRLLRKLHFTTKTTAKTTRFKEGDTVRISKYKTLFEKGYMPSWSTELFIIKDVRHNSRPPVYVLRDMEGETIKGTFYDKELQKTNYPDTYLVERVLRKKGSRAYVKWLGFSSRHNSWI